MPSTSPPAGGPDRGRTEARSERRRPSGPAWSCGARSGVRLLRRPAARYRLRGQHRPRCATRRRRRSGGANRPRCPSSGSLSPRLRLQRSSRRGRPDEQQPTGREPPTTAWACLYLNWVGHRRRLATCLADVREPPPDDVPSARARAALRIAHLHTSAPAPSFSAAVREPLLGGPLPTVE
jgi:hypothetical protein